MISLAILIRAYLVIGIILGGAAYASQRAERREGWKIGATDWADLIAVFLAAFFWLPSALFQALRMIWKEIRHP